MHVLLAIFLSFFPARYRKAIERWGALHTGNEGAFLSGLAEAMICVGFLIFYYFIFSNRMLGRSDAFLTEGAKKMGDTGVMGFGLIVLFAYLTNAVTLTLIYFLIEGNVRLIAAWVSGEVVPTLPLQLIAITHGQIERMWAEHKLGPRVPDEVQKSGPEGFDLLVASCRPKQDWHYHLNTICFEQELYQLAGQRTGISPRPFVYLLKAKPASELVRGLIHYDPEEVMHEPSKWDALKGMFGHPRNKMHGDLNSLHGKEKA